MASYSEVFSKISEETAIITFLKKDGQIRIMLGTRNLDTVSEMFGFQGYALGGHDKRCSIKNGNLAVFDMILGEARSFHIDRLIDIKFMGKLASKEQIEDAMIKYQEFKDAYEANYGTTLNMGTFDTGNGGDFNA